LRMDLPVATSQRISDLSLLPEMKRPLSIALHQRDRERERQRERRQRDATSERDGIRERGHQTVREVRHQRVREMLQDNERESVCV
jgi:hypothetical protein